MTLASRISENTMPNRRTLCCNDENDDKTRSFNSYLIVLPSHLPIWSIIFLGTCRIWCCDSARRVSTYSKTLRPLYLAVADSPNQLFSNNSMSDRQIRCVRAQIKTNTANDTAISNERRDLPVRRLAVGACAQDYLVLCTSWTSSGLRMSHSKWLFPLVGSD